MHAIYYKCIILYYVLNYKSVRCVVHVFVKNPQTKNVKDGKPLQALR